MKSLLTYASGAITVIVVYVILCSTGNLPMDCADKVDEGLVNTADSITDATAWNLMTAYQGTIVNTTTTPALNIAGVYGCKMSVKDLLQVINDRPGSGDTVNFRLGFDPSVATTPPLNPGCVYLILSKGPLSPGVPNSSLIIKTGNNLDYFCPPRCD